MNFRSIIREIIDSLLRPILLTSFRLMPIKYLAYVAGLRYANGNTLGSRSLYRVITSILGMNFVSAPEILNQRLLKMDPKRRRNASKLVWQQDTTSAWSDSHFSNPEMRAKQFVYHEIKSLYEVLRRPLSILELGCVTGGSLHILRHLDVQVSRYLGIDISKSAIEVAKSRFSKDSTASFAVGDFTQVLGEIGEMYDVLLVNLTFLFLDEEYLRQLVSKLSDVVNIIVISEKELPNQSGKASQVGDWGNSPIDYSHDYERIFADYGFTVQKGGLVPFYNPMGLQSSKKLETSMIFEARLVNSKPLTI